MTDKHASCIVLSNDLDHELQYQSMHIKGEFLYVLACDELKIEDAHEILTQAYITSKELKTIIIAANSYNIFAQNALLKLLEEPPNRTRFVLIAKNKTSFLPTIRSRLPLEDKRKKVSFQDLNLDFKNFSLKDIYLFLKSLEVDANISKDSTKEKIQSLLFMAKKHGFSLNEAELRSFDAAINANHNYQKDVYTFLPLLLMLLQKIKISRNSKG
ncbi:hypothetical protein BKH46_00715 [Helicobacter sp. 12S02634-8]|uniref:DNA polymerase III subunit delta' n=1 Tax=Helicobacter sp. 12S02634-8 TaxID=1476199 RepID=UPI000BA56D18|nr:DNA polymerase III subunit delta' [Helicobacter sp. 12S02634-8]PAF48467.1 hypothetical protein BKH46_00715 [Helicobacter sp. 12S02634-8]